MYGVSNLENEWNHSIIQNLIEFYLVGYIWKLNLYKKDTFKHILSNIQNINHDAMLIILN